jgi:hypothetical protein
MPWATVEQVTAMTGQTVDPVDVALASAMIDTIAGTSEDMPEDSISARDRGHLRKATIWQAIWIKGKPGLLTHRESHKSTSADSVMVTRESRSDVYLAPLADRELRNLSWYSTRSQYQPPPPRQLPPGLDFLNERSDDTHRWDPV